MSFESTIKDWIAIDQELHKLTTQIHDLRARRSELDKEIISYYADSNTKIIKYGDVKIKQVATNISESLTFKYLEKCLSNMVKNETQVKQMMEYIKRNRNIKQVVHIECSK
jgi:hypothetical protein